MINLTNHRVLSFSQQAHIQHSTFLHFEKLMSILKYCVEHPQFQLHISISLPLKNIAHKIEYNMLSLLLLISNRDLLDHEQHWFLCHSNTSWMCLLEDIHSLVELCHIFFISGTRFKFLPCCEVYSLNSHHWGKYSLRSYPCFFKVLLQHYSPLYPLDSYHKENNPHSISTQLFLLLGLEPIEIKFNWALYQLLHHMLPLLTLTLC